jgi:hypothetical protein
LVPPLVVATISPVPLMAFPTAKHALALTHVTPFKATLSVDGSVWAAQLEPLLAVAITVEALLVPPTAKHTLALGQLTSFSGVFVPDGGVCDVQVEPPLAVAMIVGEPPAVAPTARQWVALAHETPWRAPVTLAGGLCAVQVLPPLVVAAISGAPRDALPTAQQSLSLRQSRSLYCVTPLLGGVCVVHVGLLDDAFEVWMILPADELPPTAQQLFASGHVTPYSVLVVGDVSGPAQVIASAAGAATRTQMPIAAATRMFSRLTRRRVPTRRTRSQLEEGPRRRRPNTVPTTIPPKPTSAIGHHGIELPPAGGRASAAGTVLLTSFAPSDAVP